MRSKQSSILAILLISIATLIMGCSRDPARAKQKYFTAGQGYMKKGQYGDAAIEFRNALRLDPNFVDAYYQLSQAYLAHQDWSAAYSSLEKAIQLDPSRMDARLDRGRLYLGAREFDKAEDEADAILKIDPNNIGGYELLGAALIEGQKTDKALQAFSRVTELSPNDASAYVNLALVEIALRHVDTAETHFKKAVELNSGSIQGVVDLANFYHLQKRLPEAESVLLSGIRNNPNVAELYVQLARMSVAEGKSSQAETTLSQLKLNMPDSVEAAIAIGDYYAQNRQPDRALEEYRRSLQLSPNNLNASLRLEDYYLNLNQGAQAEQIDHKLMKQAPTDVVVRINHGRFLISQGNVTAAENELMGVVKDSTDNWQAHYYLAMAHWQDGSVERAQSELQDALRVAPGTPTILQSLVRLGVSQNNVPAVQNYAEELVEKNPGEVADRLLLGEVYERQGQAHSAEDQLSVAKSLAPENPAVHAEVAQLYFAEKKWKDAEEELERATHSAPSDSEFVRQYCAFLLFRQRLPEAISLAQRFTDANPSLPSGYIMLGELQVQSKDYSAAESAFERAIQIQPRDLKAHLDMGKVYELENRVDLAIEEYKRALELNSNASRLYAKLGDLYLHERDLDSAHQYFQKAVVVDPDFAVAASDLAWVDALQGKDLDVALGLAQRAKSELPNLPEVNDTLGWVLYKKSNYTGAKPLLEECVRVSPESPEFRFHLGMTLIALGQTARGKEELKTALQKKLTEADKSEADQALALVN